MKKFVLSFVFVTLSVLLAGCGNSEKSLSCSKDFSSSMPSGITMIQDSKIEFKNNKIESMDMIMKFEISSTYKSQFDSLMETMKSTYEKQYGSHEGITVTTNKTGDSTFEVVISIDYKNISSSTKSAIGAVGSESYSVNKKQLEGQGYTCK